MASPDSDRIENLDRISQLPESMILNILARLPLKDSARTSILSKTWKSFCSLYPIFYFDHNLFALQSLVSAKEGGGGPDINQIRDMFMDRVDYQLSGAMQLDSPIRKLALTVVIGDSMQFSRVDKWMELVRQINVEHLCITVQTEDLMWKGGICRLSVVYEFPLSVLASKGLCSAYVRGCKLGCETIVGDPINKFFCLQRLCLSHVSMDDHVLENLIRCCQGIETLVLDKCSFEFILLKLSKFPNLKVAFISVRVGKLHYVDIVDTNLECFQCHATGTEVLVSPVACAGIRELTLAWGTRIQPDLLKDLTAKFPLLEEGEFYLHCIDTLKAANNGLRKLKFLCYSPCLKEATFEPEQVEAIEVSPRYNVHLTLVLDGDNMQDIAALMDGLLWIIRPTNLTVSCRTHYVVKYLCENLYKKQEDSICNEQLIRPCWMHQLEDFHVDCPLGVPVTKKNLAAFPEQCQTLLAEQICFKFHWCFN